MALAFFIYWLFSPSWAARLWYNVRTFPQRVTSRFSSQTFLDYDSYKLDVPSIGEKIWDKIDLSGGDNEDSDWDKVDTHTNETSEVDNNDSERNENSENEKNEEEQVIKSFPRTIDFIKLPSLNITDTPKNDSPKNGSQISWYSKSDLIWVINKYLENNLDNETDILVTVEYEDDFADPQKIILQTQAKSENVVSDSSDLVNTVYTHNWSNSNKEESQNNSNTKKSNSTSTNSSPKLSVQDQRDAEEIFNILF